MHFAGQALVLGTHLGAVESAHLTGYLNEFVLRFNRQHFWSPRAVFFRAREFAVP